MLITTLILVLFALLLGLAIGYLFAKYQHSKSKLDIFEIPEVIRLSEAVEKEKELNSNLNDRIIKLSEENSGLKQRVNDFEESVSKRAEEIEKTKKELQSEFLNLAHKIFEEKSATFKQSSVESLKSLLEPFGKNISEFKTTVNETFIKRTEETSALKQELKHLRELNQTMSAEARELTQALKGESKTQGNWGELILERILENSGLTKGREYELQSSSTLEDGRRIQPDVIINLPDDKHVIIDSKVSLKAYELYFNTEDKTLKSKFLKEHTESLRNHIKNLNSKSYTSAKGIHTPDFVLLFLPIEASFGMALEADKDLYDFAWQRQIVMVTPSTLLATLRTISSIWKHEYTNKNAAEIAIEAGRLYDKVVTVVQKLQKAGVQLDTAQKTFGEAVNGLSEGRGNVLSKVEKLRIMGASSKKSLINDTDKVFFQQALENDGQIEEDSDE